VKTFCAVVCHDEVPFLAQAKTAASRAPAIEVLAELALEKSTAEPTAATKGNRKGEAVERFPIGHAALYKGAEAAA
jgi:hypothetical protein